MSAKKKSTAQESHGQDNLPDFNLASGLETGNRLFWALAGFLALALVVLFRDFIFDGRTTMLGSDMISQALQTRKVGVDAVKAGEGYPLWNPLAFCGIPFVGFLPGPMYFPLSALYFIMPLHRAIGWTFPIMMLAGGLFCYLWIRELGLAKVAAALCAVAFTFTGWVASGLNGGHDGRMFVILLTPLVFFFAERGFNRRKLVWFLLMGLAVALQILTPMIQMMYFSCLALGAYGLYRIVTTWRDEKSLAPALKVLAMFVVGFALAVSLAGVQFFPTLANQQYSHRQEGLGLEYEGWQHATSFSMHPLETVGLAVPGFSGEPSSYWGGEQFKLHAEYMGLLPLLFAAVALAKRRNRKVWFFAGLGLAALLWNFGGHTPFFHLPYNLIPKVKNFRAPNMMFFVFAFSLITLAGYGIDYLLGAAKKGEPGDAERLSGGFRVLVYCVGALVLLLLVLGVGKSSVPGILAAFLPDNLAAARLPVIQQYYPKIVSSALLSVVIGVVITGLVWLWKTRLIPLTTLLLLLAVITWGDLMRMDRFWLATGDIDRVFPRDNVVAYLQQQDKGEHRVYFNPSPFTAEGRSDFWDNSLLYFGVPAVNASMPLRLKWFEVLYGSHTERNLASLPTQWESLKLQLKPEQIQAPSADYPRIWNLLAADFIMFRLNQFTPFFEQEYPFLTRVAEDKRTGKVLYANPDAWPRFRLFGAAEVIEGDGATLARLSDPSFDPATTLILNETPEFDLSSLAGGDPGSVEVLEHGYDRIRLKVNATGNTLLYCAESYHPFWRATVDGQQSKVYRAELAMRAVYVPAGEHEVVMSYHSAPYTAGAWATLLSLLVLAGMVGWHAYRKDW